MGLIIEPGITISGVGSFTVSAPPPPPTQSTVQYLVVAGGGGGGATNAGGCGGGGAGGALTGTMTLSQGITYSINVGTGGPGTTGTGSTGANSTISGSGISTINALGGGGGVVIIAVPNAQYPTVSAPGAAVSTPPAAPGMTVLTYTSSGTYTA
jgi:hypothetical protein